MLTDLLLLIIAVLLFGCFLKLRGIHNEVGVSREMLAALLRRQ